MKILQSAPLDIQISPKLKYAGTERILLYLNQELDKMGHESLVCAPANSDLGGFGKIIPTRKNHLWKESENNRKVVRSPKAYENHYKKCLDFSLENKVDVLHDHPGQYLLDSKEYFKRKDKLNIPIVTTIHSIAVHEHDERHAKFRQLQKEGYPIHFIGISKSHIKNFERNAGIKFDGFVYNGVPLDLFPFQKKKKDYMLWLGRLSKIKGTDIAVEAAKRTGKPLIIAGEVHNPYRKEYEEKVKPYLTKIVKSEKERVSLIEKLAKGETIANEGDILFIGPVDDYQKSILYKNAYVTLQPNRWKEPFGLVPVESMATGTPTIVTNRGALPELVKDGKTGYIIESGGKIQMQN